MNVKAPLTNQPTAALTRKAFWSLMASGTTTLAFWLLKETTGIVAPPEIVGTVVSMAGAVVAYSVRDRMT